MTTMTIVDVVRIVYPGQIELGNVAFGQDGTNPIFITKWTVPDVPQPTEQELEDMIPSLQDQFNYDYFVENEAIYLTTYIDLVAQQRQYDNALSCISYYNSTNSIWSNEAIAFVAWRDSVYIYTFAQEALMQSGSRSIPTFEEFQTELPVITWPT